jgi:hypothetical protein
MIHWHMSLLNGWSWLILDFRTLGVLSPLLLDLQIPWTYEVWRILRIKSHVTYLNIGWFLYLTPRSDGWDLSSFVHDSPHAIIWSNGPDLLWQLNQWQP